MTPTETAAILRRYNEWRRGDERLPWPIGTEIGKAIDAAVDMIERLEAAETAWKISDQTVYALTEKVIPNIQEKLEADEKERDKLRAKIEAMERQEPVMWANSSTINSSRINKERGGRGDQHTCSETQTTYHDTQLYALPGAKGEQS